MLERLKSLFPSRQSTDTTTNNTKNVFFPFGHIGGGSYNAGTVNNLRLLNIYNNSPDLAAIVGFRSRLVSEYPLVVLKDDEPIDIMDFPVDLAYLLYQIEQHRTVFARSYIAPIVKRGKLEHLQVYSPSNITINYDSRDVIESFLYTGGRNKQNSFIFKPDELIYYHKPNPFFESKPGLSITNRVLDIAEALMYMQRFMMQFFDGDAMGSKLIAIEDMSTISSEFERVQELMNNISGVDMAGSSVIIGGKAAVHHLTQPTHELNFNNNMRELQRLLLANMGIPSPVFNSDSDSHSTSTTAKESVYDHLITPEVHSICHHLNQGLREHGYRIVPMDNKLYLYQARQIEVVQSMAGLIEKGVFAIEEVRSAFGFNTPNPTENVTPSNLETPEPDTMPTKYSNIGIDLDTERELVQKRYRNLLEIESEMYGELFKYRKKFVEGFKKGKRDDPLDSDYIGRRVDSFQTYYLPESVKYWIHRSSGEHKTLPLQYFDAIADQIEEYTY